MKDLEAGLEGEWTKGLDPGKVADPLERILFQKGMHNLVYIPGKYSKTPVSILVRNDVKEVLKTLIDKNLRADCGNDSDNPYVFANGQDSKDHCSGWQAISTVATEAGVKIIDLFNTTSKQAWNLNVLFDAGINLPSRKSICNTSNS